MTAADYVTILLSFIALGFSLMALVFSLRS
jgi:hypothetical protein